MTVRLGSDKGVYRTSKANSAAGLAEVYPKEPSTDELDFPACSLDASLSMAVAQPQKASDLRIAAYVVVPLVLIPAVGYFAWKKYDESARETERAALVESRRAVVRQVLKDPGSTQFRNERLTPAGWLCGELNSKNGFGAYVGFKRFYARDGSFGQLEGYEAVGQDKPATTENRIAEINSQIQFMRENGRERTRQETSDLQFGSNWGQHCV